MADTKKSAVQIGAMVDGVFKPFELVKYTKEGDPAGKIRLKSPSGAGISLNIGKPVYFKYGFWAYSDSEPITAGETVEL